MRSTVVQRHRGLAALAAAAGLLLGACRFDGDGALGFHLDSDSGPRDRGLLLVDGQRPTDGPRPIPDVPIVHVLDQTACVDTPAKHDQAIPRDQFVPPRDQGVPPEPDAKPPTPDVFVGLPSCSALFANKGVPGYVLCSETAVSCSIYFNAGGQVRSCKGICSLGGRACAVMINTNSPAGCAFVGIAPEPACDVGRKDAMCVCKRQP